VTRPPSRDRARSDLYRVFAGAFEYPDAALHEEIVAGGLRDALVRLLAGAGVVPGVPPDGLALTQLPALDDFAADYSALFDVGSSGRPPCPLHGGAWGGAERLKVMEELVRFYDHFGLRVAEAGREMPDSLGAELEFLHFLAGRQAEAVETGLDAGPYQRAEHDFLERHPGRWVPEMRARLEQGGASPFYRELVRLLDESLRQLRGEEMQRDTGGAVAAPACDRVQGIR